MDLEPAESTNKKILTAFLVVLAILVVIGSIKLVGSSKADSTSVANSVASSDNTTSLSTTRITGTTSYKNGSYSATGDYQSPGGQEAITVNVTLKDSTVTAVSISQQSNNHDSAEYQSSFKETYSLYVVGKKISDISLAHVSGSSLTSQGFNEALSEIRTDAAV